MKRKYTKKPPFYFTESTQDYRLPGFNFLYDAPEDASDLYSQLYDNVPILESAVNIYTNLINGDYEIRTKKIHANITLFPTRVVEQIYLNFYIT